MMHVIVKVSLAVALPAALAAALTFLASITDGSDALPLYRMGLTFAIAGLAFGVITWAVHRVGTLSLEMDVARRCAIADRAAMREELRAVRREFTEFRDDVKCRLMMEDVMNSHDPMFRAIFQPEEN
jgi:hypothetical protein